MPAREDRATDPAVRADLAFARAGTAYFRRVLNHVNDDQLRGPTLLPGWTRRHLIAHVGYNARAVARLVEWAATGVETPMYASPQARGAEIEMGATLPAEALRHLCEHSAIDLDVKWRDLPAERWTSTVVTAQGRTVPASETVWMRIREVWLHAMDLDAGGRFVDIPRPVLDRLLGDFVRAWEARGELNGLSLRPDGGDALGDPTGARIVAGPLPELVRWASGRGGGVGLEGEGSSAPAPRWI